MSKNLPSVNTANPGKSQTWRQTGGHGEIRGGAGWSSIHAAIVGLGQKKATANSTHANTSQKLSQLVHEVHLQFPEHLFAALAWG